MQVGISAVHVCVPASLLVEWSAFSCTRWGFTFSAGIHLALLLEAAVVCLLLLAPPYLGISEEAHNVQKAELPSHFCRTAWSVFCRCVFALAKLQEVMGRLPNAQAKRHDSLQPRQLGGIKINKRKS